MIEEFFKGFTIQAIFKVFYQLSDFVAFSVGFFLKFEQIQFLKNLINFFVVVSPIDSVDRVSEFVIEFQLHDMNQSLKDKQNAIFLGVTVNFLSQKIKFLLQ